MTARILVVDDDPPIRHLVRNVLQRQGYTIEEAVHGREALDKLASQPYDAVFLDLMMPIVSGYQVLEELRTTRPDFLQAIIVMTAASNRDVARLDEGTICRVLRKPFEIQDLIQAAVDCLALRQNDGNAIEN